MTKEEAIENIKLVRFNAAITNANSFKEALDMSIEALSHSSLPSNLDKATEEVRSRVKEIFDSMPKYDFDEERHNRVEFSLIALEAFAQLFYQAGAEWMAGQGEAIEGEVYGRVQDHINVKFSYGVGKLLTPSGISHIPADVSKYNPGDKVVVQIRKK